MAPGNGGPYTNSRFEEAGGFVRNTSKRRVPMPILMVRIQDARDILRHPMRLMAALRS